MADPSQLNRIATLLAGANPQAQPAMRFMAPNMTSLLSGEEPPPLPDYANLPPGKVPSPEDPRYANAAIESGMIGAGFMSGGGGMLPRAAQSALRLTAPKAPGVFRAPAAEGMGSIYGAAQAAPGAASNPAMAAVAGGGLLLSPEEAEAQRLTPQQKQKLEMDRIRRRDEQQLQLELAREKLKGEGQSRLDAVEAERVRMENESRGRIEEQRAQAALVEQQQRAQSGRPLTEKQPWLQALPVIGGIAAGRFAYAPRARAMGAHNEYVDRMTEVVAAAENAVLKAPKSKETAHLVAQAKKYLSGYPGMESALTPSFGQTAKAAAGGGALSAEAGMLPYQIDWATQPEESAAGQAARDRLTTGAGWMRTGVSAFPGVTGATVGSVAPTWARPALPDLPRASAVSAAARAQRSAKK